MDILFSADDSVSCESLGNSNPRRAITVEECMVAFVVGAMIEGALEAEARRRFWLSWLYLALWFVAAVLAIRLAWVLW